MGVPGDVLEFTVLKSKPRSDGALQLLRKVHSLVKPIMRNHGWVLPKFAEFFPKQDNLLGINCNRGQKICIRLRPHHSPDSFLPLEDLIGTMLHELTHNVFGPHDQKFFDYLDGLNKEFDSLPSSGWAGEGFYGRGERVGVGRSHNVSMTEAKEMALKKAEERARLSKLMGTGGKLGGRTGSTKGMTRNEILAEAAERRAKANKACGADHSGDQHLPPAIQAEADRAEEDSHHFVVDLTLESDGEADDSRSSSTVNHVKKEPSQAPSSDDIEILPMAGPSKRRTELEPREQPRERMKKLKASSASTSASPSTSAPTSTVSSMSATAWTCPMCTYGNLSPLSLACEMCANERPTSTLYSASAQIRRSTPNQAILELVEGWMCDSCLTMNKHLFWSCASCGCVKKTSARS